MRESFRDRLNRAMTVRNVKAVDIVNATGISKTNISHYMTGKSQPRSQKLFLIAKALDVSEAWLLGYDDIAMDRTPQQKEDDMFGELIHSLHEKPQLRKLCIKISKMPPPRFQLLCQLVDSLQQS